MAHTPKSVVVVSADPQPSAAEWAQKVEARAKKLGAEAPFDYDHVTKPTAVAPLKGLPGYRHAFVDVAGTLHSDMIDAVLDVVGDVIIPMPPEALAFKPTTTTVKLLEARKIPFLVVLNNWDPRDGTTDLEQTRDFVKAKGWPLARTVIRRYKVHTRAPATGEVVTQYPKGRVALEAREDYFKLALEVGYGKHHDEYAHVHGIMSQKGGAGKSTTAMNMAAVIAHVLDGIA